MTDKLVPLPATGIGLLVQTLPTTVDPEVVVTARKRGKRPVSAG